MFYSDKLTDKHNNKKSFKFFCGSISLNGVELVIAKIFNTPLSFQTKIR